MQKYKQITEAEVKEKIEQHKLWLDSDETKGDIENGSFDGAVFSHGAFVGGEFIEDLD